MNPTPLKIPTAGVRSNRSTSKGLRSNPGSLLRAAGDEAPGDPQGPREHLEDPGGGHLGLKPQTVAGGTDGNRAVQSNGTR